MGIDRIKPIIWISSSRRDLCDFPLEARRECGFALYQAQRGRRHLSAKTMKGFGGGHVIEVVENDRAGAFRVVYTVAVQKAVYVLHAFQKKSKTGIKTPKEEIVKVRDRLGQAAADYQKRYFDEGNKEGEVS